MITGLSVHPPKMVTSLVPVLQQECSALAAGRLCPVPATTGLVQVQLSALRVRKYTASSVSSKTLFFLPFLRQVIKLLSILVVLESPSPSGASNSNVPPIEVCSLTIGDKEVPPTIPPYIITLGGCWSSILY